MSTEHHTHQAGGRLRGKVALVTGAGDGQGRTACLRFAAEGARIIACDLNRETASETETLLAAAGADVLMSAGTDLGDPDAVDDLVVRGSEELGPIDIVYNNAVSMRVGSALSLSEADFRSTLDGTLALPWRVTKHAVPHMADSGGAIVNVASITGVVGTGVVGNSPALAAYGVAKAGLVRLTEILAIELAPRGIRVNAISPGTIDTPAASAVLSGELRERHLDHLLIPRIGRPEDVVDAAVFLASDEASYITGHNLIVDGGWTASGGAGTGAPAVHRALDAVLGGTSPAVART